MTWAHAGQYGAEGVGDSNGRPLPGQPVHVYQPDGVTTATLYADRTKGSTIANPTTTDSNGNLTLWLEPGQYVLSMVVSGRTVAEGVTVLPDPADLPAAGDCVLKTGATMTGELVAPDLKVSGLTGATAASRYAGATTTGPPASGTFATGDYVITQDGTIYVCTVAGTPGTWKRAGAGFILDSHTLTADPTLPTQGGGWTDVSGLAITIPANVPYCLSLSGHLLLKPGASTPAGGYNILGRVTDSATATIYYSFFAYQDYFVAGSTATTGRIVPLDKHSEGSPLSVDTPVKVQLSLSAATALTGGLVTLNATFGVVENIVLKAIAR